MARNSVHWDRPASWSARSMIWLCVQCVALGSMLMNEVLRSWVRTAHRRRKRARGRILGGGNCSWRT